MDNLPDCQYEYGYEAQKAKVVCSCCECWKNIYEGDTYYEVDGMNFCEDCILDFKKIGEI
ncbi:hypothetical protein [Clostridium tetani]|uniref:hypothetical protein n=1 Tax=Clostridium tetani TaxID=1513 RepID=UPI0005746CF2|nr:hypothetical protein [Clostridium tetani]KHO39295.1 hypothetical protein OR62_06725 [Clostridium tetani]BDR86094.1 hypothetical protein N071400001_07020 [Clostridium tetani]